MVFAADIRQKKELVPARLIEVSKQGNIFSFTACGDQQAFKEALAILTPLLLNLKPQPGRCFYHISEKGGLQLYDAI